MTRSADGEGGLVRLFLAGDVMLGRGVDQILRAPCDPELREPSVRDAREYVALAEAVAGPIRRGCEPAYPWGDVPALLDELRPDARIVNLETAVTRSGAHDPVKGVHYRVSPENATAITAAGIDVCALANNHVLDFGERGLLDTLDTLDELGVGRCGAGRDLDEAMRPAVVDLPDGTRIAVFAIGGADAGVPESWAAGSDRAGLHFAAAYDAALLERLRETILPWRDGRTIVVLSVHWGDNWGFDVPQEHRDFARRLVEEAGVHVVHGHSSHHVKGVELLHHRGLVLYGCGDLLTDYEGIRGHERYRPDLGLLWLVTLGRDGRLDSLEMVPTRMQRLQIVRATPADAAWLAATLTRHGRPLGTAVLCDGLDLALEG